MSDHLPIPQIRDRLQVISEEMAELAVQLRRPFLSRASRLRIAVEIEARALEVAHLAEATKRRPPTRKAPRQARKMTPTLANSVANYTAAHPEQAMHVIARRFGVNGGRVSEAYSGKNA